MRPKIDFYKKNKTKINYHKKYSHIVAIIDKTINEKYPWLTNNFDDKIIIEAKETNKNIDEVNKLLKEIAHKKLDRNSCLVAVGGGVIGDITGFIASIYMRGIDFIQIPTTFMSMCDAINGKVAISNGSKNIFGTFYSPKRTIIFEKILIEMPKKLILQGMSEVIKHYLITRNKKLEVVITKLLNSDKMNIKDLIESIKISHKIKNSFVKRDPKDIKGVHKALSLGHTFANSIEKIYQTTINHGEAVLKGMKYAVNISYKLRFLPKKLFDKDMKLLRLLDEKVKTSRFKITAKHLDLMLSSFRTDKLSINRTMRFVLINKKRHLIKSVNEQLLMETILNEG